MVDPVTLSASALATSLLTKMLEKAAEKLGEKLPNLGAEALKKMGALKQLLWRKAPDTANALDQVVYQPELVHQQPENYGINVLTQKVESLAQADPEVAEAVEALVAEVKPKLPPQVRQLMAVDIDVQGSFETGNMTQKATPGASSTEQTMLKDVKVGKNMKVGDLYQG